MRPSPAECRADIALVELCRNRAQRKRVSDLGARRLYGHVAVKASPLPGQGLRPMGAALINSNAEWGSVNVNSWAAPWRPLEQARRTRQKREAAPHEAVEYRGPRGWDGEHDFWVVD